MTDWAILEYESGRHAVMPNLLGRIGVACVLPLVESENRKLRTTIRIPALPRLLFMATDERRAQTVLDTIRHAQKVWRHNDGRLVTISDRDLSRFLDSLDKREKKPKAARKNIDLASAAENDWFALYVHLYGLQAAIKRFGKDLSMQEAA